MGWRENGAGVRMGLNLSGNRVCGLPHKGEGDSKEAGSIRFRRGQEKREGSGGTK